MGGLDFLVTYVKACSSGLLAPSECGPAWQFGAIGVLLVSAVAVFVVLRMRAYMRSARN